MKIVWSSVLYNPEREFFENFYHIVNGNHNLITAIYDNSEKSTLKQDFIDKIDFISSNEENKGLGEALNTIGQFAFSVGAEWLVYFDQDSFFNADSVNDITSFLREDVTTKDQRIASISFRSSALKQGDNKSCVKNVIMPQGSAIAFRVGALKNIGYHDKTIFLDCLDYFFDLKVRNAGYYQISFNCVRGVDHLKLQPSQSLSFFGKKLRLFLLRNYSHKRRKTTLALSFKLLIKSIIKKDLVFSLFVIRFICVYIILQGIAILRRKT